MRAAAALVLALLLAGCERYTLVAPGTVEVGSDLVVASPIQWNRERDGSTEMWTVNGPALEELRFVKGLEDGDRLFSGTDAKKLPAFSPKMTPVEVQEFFEQSFQRAGVPTLSVTGLRPAKFGDGDGFRFEFTYALEDGLEREGFAVGAVRAEKLYLIVYSGTKLYFYGKHKADAEAIVASARLRTERSP